MERYIKEEFSEEDKLAAGMSTQRLGSVCHKFASLLLMLQNDEKYRHLIAPFLIDIENWRRLGYRLIDDIEVSLDDNEWLTHEAVNKAINRSVLESNLPIDENEWW